MVVNRRGVNSPLFLMFNLNYTTMRMSVLYREEAEREVANYMDGRTGLYVRKDEADCVNFPCPDELDSWGGTTMALYVEDEDGNEVFACAYWLEFFKRIK